MLFQVRQHEGCQDCSKSKAVSTTPQRNRRDTYVQLYNAIRLNISKILRILSIYSSFQVLSTLPRHQRPITACPMSARSHKRGKAIPRYLYKDKSAAGSSKDAGKHGL